MKYLVWIDGLRGPEAQLWSNDIIKDGKPVETLKKHELTPLEANLSLDELKKRYPYEAKS